MAGRGCPAALCVGEALALGAATSGQPPAEVSAALVRLGFPALRACRRHKVSFHATYMLEFDGLVPHSSSGAGKESSRAVLHLLGAQLGDKPLFRLDHPISAAVIARASALAQEAGVRTPQVLATGEVARWGPLENVPFVLYEFIATETVEDEVAAPRREWGRIVDRLRAQLAARSLARVDTEPLPRFEDVFGFVEYLGLLAEEAGADELRQALARVEEHLRSNGIEPVPPSLIHQDLNCGNVLCSTDPTGFPGAWRLDALIDWEGAAVADPRIAFEKAEPWPALRRLACAVKARWLSARAHQPEAPRCEAGELLEDYEELGEALRQGGWAPTGI